MRNSLKIFSYLLHPILIPCMAIGCYFYISEGFFTVFEIGLSLFHGLLLTILLPICIYFMLRSMRMMHSSIMIEKREERKVPVFMNIVLLAIMVFFIWDHNRVYDVKHFFISYMISHIIIFGTLLLNKKYSIHIMCFSSFFLFIIKSSISYHLSIVIPLALLIFLFGALLSSRLAIKAHTYTELILGSLIGMLPYLILWNYVFRL